MEVKEKILDTEECYLSPIQPAELSLSSGIISLLSANRLTDLSLTSDLTDSEAENEATVLTSRDCGDCKGHAGDRLHGENRKMPDDPLKSSMFPYSQRSVDSFEKVLPATEVSIDSRQSVAPSVINEEKYGHEDNLSDKKLVRDFYSDMNAVNNEKISSLQSLSLDDVKVALQQHSNLLSDRHLLNDLLKSLDEKIEKNPEAGVPIQSSQSAKKQKSTVYQKNYVENGLQEENKPEASDKQFALSIQKSQSGISVPAINFNQQSHVFDLCESFGKPHVHLQDDHGTSRLPLECLHNTLLNSESVEEEIIQKYPSKLGTHPIFERHVKFQSPIASLQDHLVHMEGQEHGDNQELPCSDQQSLKVLKQLAGLRWRLVGWEDVGSSPPTDSSSSLSFLHQLLISLQTLQLEKKHLKEELVTTMEKLKSLREESYTKQHLYAKREARLVEADRQLEELQEAWASAQEAGQQEATRLRTHCHILRQETASLKKEVECLRNEVTELKAAAQQYDLMKTRMQETEELLAASKKNIVEVSEENMRVNLCLEENKKYLQELEEVKFPQLHHELEDERARARRLEDCNKQLSQAKAHLEEDLHMLQEQHKVLLKKMIEEQEKKVEAEQQKIALEKEVRGMPGKVEMMKTQLHLHYQAQVEDLVTMKSSALQEQLKILESDLKKNIEKQLSAQVESHQVASKKLQKRYEEEIRIIKSSHEREFEKVYREVKELRKENHHLHQQRQGIICAVSSVLGMEHQTNGNTSLSWGPIGPGSSEPTGASSPFINVVRDESSKNGSCTTSDRSIRKKPQLKSSSSTKSDSIMFPEGKQTASHLNGNLHCVPRDGTSKTDYQENQKDFVVPSDFGMNPKLGGCGEWKIRKASEILQASDLTDEDVCFQDVEVIPYNPLEDQEMARILRELRMQVNLSTQGSQGEAPTHDTSLDQDPAMLSLHRLSQVSSVLSQYVSHTK